MNELRSLFGLQESTKTCNFASFIPFSISYRLQDPNTEPWKWVNTVKHPLNIIIIVVIYLFNFNLICAYTYQLPLRYFLRRIYMDLISRWFCGNQPMCGCFFHICLCSFFNYFFHILINACLFCRFCLMILINCVTCMCMSCRQFSS